MISEEQCYLLDIWFDQHNWMIRLEKNVMLFRTCVHVGHRKVNDLLPLGRDGQVNDCHVSFLEITTRIGRYYISSSMVGTSTLETENPINF